MWLFWPLVFAVLGFGSVAYSDKIKEFPTRRLKREKPDETPDSESDSGDASVEKILSGFDEATRTLGLGTDTRTGSNVFPQIPEGGFNVTTGTHGPATDTRTGSNVFPQIPEGGFNVTTGTLGRGLPGQHTSLHPLTLKEAIPCYDKSPEPRTEYRGEWWIFHNYVPMSTKVSCWESVTYVTHSRWFDLVHIPALVERWRAPISVAVYTQSDDFRNTLDVIRYLKSCTSPLVSQYVTFHLYCPDDQIPDNMMEGEKILSTAYDCSVPLPLTELSEARTEAQYYLYYPNLGRNIARENAPTHYHIVANIDTYPSANLASDFLEMIRRNDQIETSTPNPRVFVLPPFEVIKGETVPFNKTELVKMLNEGTAVPLPDKHRCPLCQNMPEAALWRSTPEADALNVFFIGKRTGSFESWEPIFIGTEKDPMYIDKITEDGTLDRRLQGWLLCHLDYDFLILDNAFVVRPLDTVDVVNYDFSNSRMNMDERVTLGIMEMYHELYGQNPLCAL